MVSTMLGFTNPSFAVIQRDRTRGLNRCAMRPKAVIPVMQSTAPATKDVSGGKALDASIMTIYSVPASNCSARCLYMISRKGLDDKVEVISPKDLGGTKSAEFLELNPLGLIPTVVVHDSPTGKELVLYESDVICKYIADKYDDIEPSFLPVSPEKSAKSNLVVSILSQHVAPYHRYMYKKLEGDRESMVSLMKKGFNAIEKILDQEGPYIVGEELSVADAYLWGTYPFYDFMLPTFFGWHPHDGRPKLAAWHAHMCNESHAARETYQRVHEALVKWWENGRWEDLGMTALTGYPKSPVS